jgi:glycosyltransferase involved in cell wall biosynthesis
LNDDFSYIIPYRHNVGRLKNLISVIKWLEKLNCEVIVVEQDVEQRINLESYSVNHVFTWSPRPFNKSWACNVGAQIASNEMLAFGDADIVIHQNMMEEAQKLLKRFQVVSPYDEIIDLSQTETADLQRENKIPEIKKESRPGTNLTGGVVFFHKDAFNEICGWCEDFEGWGGEDDFMTWKVNAWLQSAWVNGAAFHLWHPIIEPNKEFYEKNLDLLRKCQNWESNKIVNWILESKESIGNPKKYLETST